MDRASRVQAGTPSQAVGARSFAAAMRRLPNDPVEHVLAIFGSPMLAASSRRHGKAPSAGALRRRRAYASRGLERKRDVGFGKTDPSGRKAENAGCLTGPRRVRQPATRSFSTWLGSLPGAFTPSAKGDARVYKERGSGAGGSGARGGPLRPVVALPFCSRIAAATASGASAIVSPTNSGVFRALSHAEERDTQV